MRSLILTLLTVAAVASLVFAQKQFAHDEPSAPATKKKITTSVYIIHAGDSDKPIDPIIISEVAVPESEILATNKYIEPTRAKLTVVESALLNSMVSETHSKIAKIAADRKSDYAYGTCEIHVVEAEDRSNRVLEKGTTNMKRILDRAQSVELLEALIEKTNPPKEPEQEKETTKTAREGLRTELSLFLNRIKPRETKK